jgi:hypothetical protein
MRTVDSDTFSYGHSIMTYYQAVGQYGRKKTLSVLVATKPRIISQKKLRGLLGGGEFVFMDDMRSK